ncbi:GspE/PulE family protein [Rhodoferax sp.]|uniref:GspE/PulE family protein n=1 Tax=Rhodoferax sp. TaxID=50421 RepID=UPI00273096B9|nr:ATPase, T2SS/T4P/T4SS family [Rhodoferax sp.]MDP1529036.1 ATPase, T2SS/T4P/T4SS family [Rhodoferax sp.]MDP1942779.1 ATPase, T2SS/T4P/T4SS family [Rhodoferax sp.]MDP2442497.1 ATPase, T2SS/T4P/T4SS family [Rhodoferax sp.]MDZ4207112.1 ATPase, T2SS/T4P/T4SS family [Rhodoferax sp.]
MTLADTLFPKEDAKTPHHGLPKPPAAGQDKAQAQAFNWPAPPFAIYQSPQSWREPEECDIEGLNGAIRRCLLITLDPGRKVAVIQIEQSKTPVSLPFSQFLRITLKKLLHPQEISTSEQFSDILGHRAIVDYHLQLKNSTKVSGLTIGCVETNYGLFLFPPVGQEGTIERVFMPHEAFTSFTLGSHIGKVLVDHQIVTEQQVEQAAEEQNYLRNRKLGDYLLDTAVLFPEQLIQALAQQSKMPMIRVGEALTLLGYISDDQLKLALEKQKTERSVPIGELLVKMGFLTRHDLITALARKMGYPVVDVKQFPIEDAALKKIPMSTALRLNVMPLMLRDNMTVVAAVDPTQRKMLEELEFLVQGRVIATLGDEVQIRQKIRETYEKFGLHHNVVDGELDLLEETSAERSSSSELLESMELNSGDEAAEEEEKAIEQSDNTLVRLINTMIIEAHARGVSDIHVESQPRRAKVRIRFRKDGMLSPYLELPHTYRAALVARLKIMADLDISERRKPQDGKINFSKFSKKHRLELRIATIPTANGLEDVVMRLLASSKPIAMNKLGLTEVNYTQLHDAISRPYGMVLCVGPTGSGKTTTLHSVLGFLNTPDRKIWTAEDPIEITQPDLRQVQINPKIDWTFAKALRSFLRADPDIIMVGEIRDAETAQIAIEASLTGHMVLSTLHTNSAAETVTRLIDMGMDPFNFADSLLAVLAQRLARKLCTTCRTSERASDDYVDELLHDYLHAFPEALRPTRDEMLAQWLHDFGSDGSLKHYHAPGCPKCMGTGLSGRVGLHELMSVNPGVRRLIQTGARSELVQLEAFQSGKFRTLRQDGIGKVLAGLTTIEEVRANSNA